MRPIKSIQEINEIGLPAFVSKYELRTAMKEFGDTKLHILNYDQIESPRFIQEVEECRGMVVEESQGHFRVIAKPLDRFYNYNEAFCVMDKFNADKPFEVENKYDGSLIVVYRYKGEWRVNTRGSFAEGEVPSGGISWEKLVMDNLGLRDKLNKLNATYNEFTLVFELVGPYNQVVIQYKDPELVLLTAIRVEEFNSGTWQSEIDSSSSNDLCVIIEVKNAYLSSYENFQEAYDHLISPNLNSDIEGWVFKQGRHRLKYKIPKYIERHYLVSDRKAALAPKNILPIVAKNEHHELMAAYPFMREKYEEMTERLSIVCKEADALHEQTQTLSTLEFAKSYNKNPSFHCIINARKEGKLPSVWLREQCVSNVNYALKIVG